MDLHERLRAALPHGRPLSDSIWRQRHNGFLTLLWLHVLGLWAFALIRGYGVVHATLEAGVIAAFAIASLYRWKNRDVAATIVVSGLLSASAVLVHLSGGTIEAHFHFFVMMTLVPLYQSWTPFVLALVYVVAHHAVMGYVDPTSVYNHPAALANPVKWALVHGGFILAASVTGLIVWKRNEELREKTEGLEILELKQRSARDLNDNVVQHLAVAKLASDLGDRAAVDEAIERSLSAAREIVGGLLPDEIHPGEFRRENGTKIDLVKEET